ncbi:hypothetical protein NX786_17910 [Telluria mixta]|uniref:Uncharacterized protein n=1 Tax=Telluria mixta TaxID=34071 RepID=A0ABT2C1F3_9BURK|nr:hypothetical protein [Telluria mixta]MCS0631213.1 hypothetical protein [Telluria mixta]WEM95752.1 hypothetical protein P0M04_30505 [Telluria mixta]
MKRRILPAKVTIRLALSRRFRDALWRYEPFIRISQLIAISWVTIRGAELVAHAIMHAGRLIAQLDL